MNITWCVATTYKTRQEIKCLETTFSKLDTLNLEINLNWFFFFKQLAWLFYKVNFNIILF